MTAKEQFGEEVRTAIRRVPHRAIDLVEFEDAIGEEWTDLTARLHGRWCRGAATVLHVPLIAELIGEMIDAYRAGVAATEDRIRDAI